MSPEQATGSDDIDGRSDQYSLACVVYEMLVGEPPFTGPSAQAVIARHSLDMVSPPSIVRATIPDAVEGAILRGLSKVRADRYATTALFAEALNTPSAATGAHRRATVERAGRRPRRLWWTAPVAALAVAVVGYVAVRSARAGRGSGVAGLDPRHIAVLYFADESRAHSLGYLADGLTESLIDALRQVPALSVVSRNGAAAYRGSAAPLDSIGRALAVGTILRGSVDDAGGRYRVSVSLVDGASGADLGQRVSFEQPAGAVLAIRDSLARRVAEFLRVRLGEELRLREEQAGTRSVAAWSLMQQAEQSRKRADALFEHDSLAAARRALELADSLAAGAQAADPQWAEPSVLRSAIAYRQARIDLRPAPAAPWIDKGLAFAAAALKIDPRNADAERWCDEGVRRFPGNLRFAECQLWLMTSSAKAPDVARAWQLLDEVVRLAPTSQRAYVRLESQNGVAAVLARAGLADSARHVLARSRGGPDVDAEAELLSFQAFAYLLLGDRDEALRLLKEQVAANPAHRAGLARSTHWWWRNIKDDPRFKQLIGTAK